MPDFRRILRSGVPEDETASRVTGGEGEENIVHDGVGIALLVVLHLLELWAVEMVGAGSVAEAWDDALS
jgi:hypothetical protein